MERGKIILLGLLSLGTVVPIFSQSAQSLALGSSPTRSTFRTGGV